MALGSNLDDPPRQLRLALGGLARLPDSRLVTRSRLWRSPPLGPPDQPDYANAVAGLLTRLEAGRLLSLLQQLERELGRTAPVLRWGPRVIDLDLLVIGREESARPGLMLPHPGLHERDFVLYPLAEVAPALWVPGRGRVETLLARVADRGLVPWSSEYA